MFRLDALITSELPTTQDVLDCINGKRGQRIPVPVVELLDGNLAPKNVLPDGTNDLTANAFIFACQYRDNATSSPRLDCDLTLSGEAGQWIDPSTDFVLISDVELKTPPADSWKNYKSGTVLMKCPVGLFRFPVVDTVYGDAGAITYTCRVFAPEYRLTKLYPQHDYVVPVGYPISTVLQVLLRMDARSPDEGGRAPSGVPYPGSPQTLLPVFAAPGTYCATGVLATSLGSIDVTDGTIHSPAGPYGVVKYSPYGGARVDPVTYAPLSPMTGLAMTALTDGRTPTYFLDGVLNLMYRPSSGEFFLPFGGSQPGAWNPLAPSGGAPLPGGRKYFQPDVLTPFGEVGDTYPSLYTWPYNYDGAGPRWQITTAAPVTTGGSPSPGPSTIYPTGGDQVIAQRAGLGLVTVLSAGTYAADSSTTTADPVAPSQNVITPNAPTAGRWIFSAPGWVFAAGICTVVLNVNVSQNNSAPSSSGALAISCDIYEVAGGGGTTLRGSLPVGASLNQAASELALSCSATLGTFTPAAGSHLRFDVSLHVTGDVTFTGNATLGETGSIIGQSLKVTLGTPPTLPASTTYLNPGANATDTPRTQSGTGIVWPDTNAPGLAPSGCDVNGPNWPSSRISIADQTDVLYETMTWSKDQNLMQFWNQLADAANLQHFILIPAVPDVAHLTDRSHDKLGVATTYPKPFYTSGTVPSPVRTYSNEANPTDGRWTGVVTHHLLDESGIVNKVTVFSQNNTDGSVIVSTLRNDTNGLYAWNHIHATLNKIIQDDAIATQAQADDRAQLELANGNRAVSALEIAVPYDPLISTEDAVNVIVIDHTTNTTLLDGTGDPWFVTSVSSSMTDDTGQVAGITRLTLAKFVTL